MVTDELKNWCLKYEDFWELWKENKYNNLEAHEISILETFKLTQFKTPTHNQPLNGDNELTILVLKLITFKLKDSYKDYQEMIVNKFLFFIVWLSVEQGQKTFFNTDINDLQLEQPLKDKLKSFGYKTVGELMASNDDLDFRREEVFINVLSVTKELKLVYKDLVIR